MNDIIWQNCSKYSSHAELLIVHMGNCIPASLKLAEIIHSVFPSLLACQHTHNDWCTLIRTLREDHKMRGNYEKCEWKIEQYCALGGMVFCREYLIFSPSLLRPTVSSKSTRSSLSFGTRCLNTKLGIKSPSLQSNYHPSIIERTLFLRYFNFREISNDFFQ